MGLFDSFVKMLVGNGNKETASNHKIYMIGDDALYNDHTDVLRGMVFVATMLLRTPLNVLEHDGEIFEGPVSKAPKYGTQADGIWAPATKTWKELGFDLPEFPPGMRSSEIGLIPQDGGDYLLFLKDFRRIVESGDSVESKIERINKLHNLNPVYSSYLGDSAFGEKWFGRHISCVPGISCKVRENLKAAGINSIDELRKTTDDCLLKIKGIGPSNLTKIREYLKTI